MKLRVIGLIIYAVILSGAAYLATQMHPSVSYHTTRVSMLPNHLVQADDLQPGGAGQKSAPSAIVGRYARHFIPAGEKVSEESFAAMPSLKDVKAAWVVPVQRASISAGVDAGRTVRLCNASKLVGTTRARVVFCETGDAGTCLLVVDIAPQVLATKGTSVASLHAVAESKACP